MFTGLGALTNQATYETLLASANTAAAAIPTGRVVIALPDGTVVIDTARTDGDPAVPTSNTYAHFQAKTREAQHGQQSDEHDAGEDDDPHAVIGDENTAEIEGARHP